jgi:HAD superfamily hydrolase (TIGR01509 family)
VNSPAIKAVIFDLGGVLISIHHERAIGLWADGCGASIEEVARLYYSDTLYRQMECGQMPIEQYHRHVVRQLGHSMSLEAFIEGWNSMLGDVLPGIETLLDELARQVRLICLSNTNAPHAAVFRTSLTRLFARFERVFYSHEMACRKPEPVIYRQVLDYLALPAAAVAFVDDRPENVAGAVAVGLRGICSMTVAETAAGLQQLGLLV